MDKNRIEGKVRRASGAMKDIAGGALGRPGLKARGKVEKIAGRMQESAGRIRDEARAESRRQEERRRGEP